MLLQPVAIVMIYSQYSIAKGKLLVEQVPYTGVSIDPFHDWSEHHVFLL